MYSNKWVKRAWNLDDDRVKGNRLLLLIALAEHANKDGRCWPSVPTLAAMARVSKSTAKRDLAWLEEAGYFVVAQRGVGRGRRTVYQLMLKESKTTNPFTDEKGVTTMNPFSGDESAEKGSNSAAKGFKSGDKRVHATSSNGEQQLKEQPQNNYNTADARTSALPSLESEQPSPSVQAKTDDDAVQAVVEAWRLTLLEFENSPPKPDRADLEAARDIVERDFTPEQVREAVATLKGGWWQGKHLSLANLSKQIGAVPAKSRRKPKRQDVVLPWEKEDAKSRSRSRRTPEIVTSWD